MRVLLQTSYDGASVNHSLHRYLRDTFISELLLGVGDCHQLERAAVNDFRSDPFVKEVFGMVSDVVQIFRKKELMEMNVSADNSGYKVLKKIYKGRWMQGTFAAFKAFFNAYHMISGGVKILMKTRTTPEWQLVARLWSDLHFLQLVVGSMDIAHALKVAEQRLQPHDINFVERGPIVSVLLQVLRHDVKQGEHFSALEKSLRQEGGNCTSRGMSLTKCA